MTASIESLAELIAQRVGRDWVYSPSPAPGVLDFTVDDRHFRLIVLDEAQGIEGIVVYREGESDPEFAEEVERHLTATESAQIQWAQELVEEYDERLARAWKEEEDAEAPDDAVATGADESVTDSLRTGYDD